MSVISSRAILRSNLVNPYWISFNPYSLNWGSIRTNNELIWVNILLVKDAPTMSLIKFVHAFISLKFAWIDVNSYIITNMFSLITVSFSLIINKSSNLTSTRLKEVPTESISCPIKTSRFRMMNILSYQSSETFIISFMKPSFNKRLSPDIYSHSFSMRYYA